MTRLSRCFAQALLIGGVILASGMLAGAAKASDPADVAKLMETRSCANCDLSEANLAGWTLEKADLSGANLRDANLYKITLTSADLTGADLSGANLSGAKLAGAKGAVLAGAMTDPKTICPDGNAGPCK